MGAHARPRLHGRHRKPSNSKRMMASTAAVTSGTIAAGVIILGSQASPAIAATAPVPVHAMTEQAVLKTRAEEHLFHLRHLLHLEHLRIEKLRAEERRTERPTVVHALSEVSGHLGCGQLEALWESAGGSSTEAFMAAEIAMAESGGNQYAVSPTNDYGYWQINGSHGPSMATFNPIGNARAAVEISSDGTNWTPWTTYTAGLYRGRC